jgi:uncharacterized membrane protein
LVLRLELELGLLQLQEQLVPVLEERLVLVVAQ